MNTNQIIITILVLIVIYQAYQQKKLKKSATNTANSARTIFELDEDLIAERDSAIRDKKETEQELISVSNKLKLKNQEVSKKDAEISRLNSEKSKVEIALNEKIKELKNDCRDEAQNRRAIAEQLEQLQTKYSQQSQLLDNEQLESKKLEEKLEQLETDYQQKLTDLTNQLNKAQTKTEKTKQLVQENINLAQAKITALENQLISLAKQKIKGKKDAQSLLKKLTEDFQQSKSESEKLVKELTQKNNEQLRQINLLFDPQAKNYETIDFNGLYSLLENQKQKDQECENTISQLTQSIANLNKELSKYD